MGLHIFHTHTQEKKAMVRHKTKIPWSLTPNILFDPKCCQFILSDPENAQLAWSKASVLIYLSGFSSPWTCVSLVPKGIPFAIWDFFFFFLCQSKNNKTEHIDLWVTGLVKP